VGDLAPGEGRPVDGAAPIDDFGQAVPSRAMPGSPRPPRPPRIEAELDHDPDLVLDEDASWSGLAVSGDFAGAEGADAAIVGSRLEAVVLTGSRLPRLHVSDCSLVGCELSGALWEQAELTRVELRDCRLSGFVCTLAQWRDVTLSGCRLDQARLRMTKGQRVAFDHCDLRGADLYEVELAEARFDGCDLTGVELSRATLSGAHLTGSTLDDIKGVEALRGAAIDSSQVVTVGLALLHAAGILIDDEDGSAPGPP
jgi:uncharacterized protein YjbI with pentapeptide repeats